MNQKIVLEQPAVREKELFRLLRMDENDEDWRVYNKLDRKKRAKERRSRL